MMRKFTAEEDQFLKDNYMQVPAASMSRMLGRSKSAAPQRMKVLGLIVPEGIIEQFKQDSRLKKGNCPFNKGKRQPEFMSSLAIERTKGTRFSKGQCPHNTKSDFDISVRTDKTGITYKYIRISLGKWVPFHRYTWQQVNGEIPKGRKLVFKDANSLNCELGNLELLTAGELMKRNSLHNYPKPIAQAIQLRGVVNRQIKKHIKRLKDEK